MLDVSPLTPDARRVVQAAGAVYVRHTGAYFVGLIVLGSALKGGLIPGSSDLDMKLYLADALFTDEAQLPLALGMAIQRDLSQVDLVPFRYIQCQAVPSTPPPYHVGPVPGTYHLVAGRLPVPEATMKQLRQAAHTALAGLTPVPAFVTDSLLEHGRGRLSATIRLLCTKVWPTLCHVLTLQQQDGFAVWRLPKDRALALVPENTALGRAVRVFYSAVRAYYPAEASVEQALAVIEHGIAVLQAAAKWYGETYRTAEAAAQREDDPA